MGWLQALVLVGVGVVNAVFYPPAPHLLFATVNAAACAVAVVYVSRLPPVLTAAHRGQNYVYRDRTTNGDPP